MQAGVFLFLYASLRIFVDLFREYPTTLLGFGMREMVAFYHQKWDTPEVVPIEPLLNVLKLSLEWVRNGGE